MGLKIPYFKNGCKIKTPLDLKYESAFEATTAQRLMLHDGWEKHTPILRFKTNYSSAKQTLNLTRNPAIV